MIYFVNKTLFINAKTANILHRYASNNKPIN